MIATLALWSLCSAESPIEPGNAFDALNHRAWRVKEGAPPDIWALGQSVDGYLWLATGNGLYSFDGSRFERYVLPQGQRFLSNNMTALKILPCGEKWIGYYSEGVSRLTSAGVTNFGAAQGVPDGTVYAFAVDADGALWAAISNGLGRFANGRWEVVREAWNFPNEGARWVLADTRGTLWVATTNSVVKLPRGSKHFEATGVADVPLAVMQQAPDGAVWISDRVHGTRALTTPDGELVPVAAFNSSSPLHDVQAVRLLFDRSDRLWATDGRYGGVALMRPIGDGATDSRTKYVDVEAFRRRDGLTADVAVPILQDREDNIWVGTNLGLNQFRRRTVRVMAESGATLPSGLLASDGSGGALVAAGDVLWRTDGSSTREVRRGLPTGLFSAHRGADGALWLRTQLSLWRMFEGALEETPLPRGAVGRDIRAMTTDTAGALWASITDKGVFRFKDGTWTLVDSLQTGLATVIVSDSPKRMWFGYAQNRVAVVEAGWRREYSLAEGLDVGNVTALHADGNDVLVAGEEGFAQLRSGRFRSLAPAQVEAFTAITGIVSTLDDNVWLNGGAGVVRISRAELRRALDESSRRPIFTLFNDDDGLPGIAIQANATPTAIAGDHGVWFATNQGVAWIDPVALHSNPDKPFVAVREVIAEDKPYPASDGLMLPAGTTNVEIAYTATSLTLPERVRFRYKLDGVDEDWRDAGIRRSAFYTRLNPGSYRFSVITANEDGVWNDAEATLDFGIAPTFFQTPGFLALCGLAAITLVWFGLVLRIRQVAARVEDRLLARSNERERIARDLHDTLLQDTQALIYSFQAEADQLPCSTPVRVRMEQVLDRADKALADARDFVTRLRAPTETQIDLPHALSSAWRDIAGDSAQRFQLLVEGEPKAIQAEARDEIYRIGREALANAIRHAQAQSIELEIVYDDGQLILRVRDDGNGIDGSILEAGAKRGHWGIAGMRERANSFGARLEIWSGPGVGTEIELKVPAPIAYVVFLKRWSPFGLRWPSKGRS